MAFGLLGLLQPEATSIYKLCLNRAAGMILGIPLLVSFTHCLVNSLVIRHTSQASCSHTGAVGTTWRGCVGQWIKAGQVEAILFDLLRYWSWWWRSSSGSSSFSSWSSSPSPFSWSDQSSWSALSESTLVKDHYDPHPHDHHHHTYHHPASSSFFWTSQTCSSAWLHPFGLRSLGTAPAPWFPQLFWDPASPNVDRSYGCPSVSFCQQQAFIRSNQGHLGVVADFDGTTIGISILGGWLCWFSEDFVISSPFMS